MDDQELSPQQHLCAYIQTKNLTHPIHSQHPNLNTGKIVDFKLSKNWILLLSNRSLLQCDLPEADRQVSILAGEGSEDRSILRKNISGASGT